LISGKVPHWLGGGQSRLAYALPQNPSDLKEPRSRKITNFNYAQII
jgi:hypothetical protein